MNFSESVNQTMLQNFELSRPLFPVTWDQHWKHSIGVYKISDAHVCPSMDASSVIQRHDSTS